MQQYFHYLFIWACLIVTFILYNKQLAAIPLLTLALFLFYLLYKEYKKLKK